MKFVCGKSDGHAVAPGEYWTAINVHNPTSKPVKFRKKIATALPSEQTGQVTKFFDGRLGPDEALEIDRKDIFKHANQDIEFLKGFVIIESKVELDIVAVYTVAGREQQVVTIHTERVLPRRQEAFVRAEPGCCSEMGGIDLEFSKLPFPSGPLPSMFIFDQVEFTRIYEEIKFESNSLWCVGGEESPPNSGNYYPATVRLDFSKLPCRVCKIIAEVDGHGPEARIEGQQLNGGTQQAICPGDKRTLTISASHDKPFISLKLSGEEAEWFRVRLE